jgi:hypothetical protein
VSPDPPPRGGVPQAGRAPLWILLGFLDRLDQWVERESPPDELRLLVTAWIMTRFDDPYQGVRREGKFPNLWFGPVPDAVDTQGRLVACAYWIDEVNHTVRCDSFGSFPPPL